MPVWTGVFYRKAETMIIDRETAVNRIAAGDARFDGCTDDNGLHWIVTDYVLARVDYCPVSDDELLIGCVECGTLVSPEPDEHGCGCHCPDCGDTL